MMMSMKFSTFSSSIPINIKKTLENCRDALLQSSSSPHQISNLNQQIELSLRELEQLQDAIIKLEQQQQQQQQQDPILNNSLSASVNQQGGSGGGVVVSDTITSTRSPPQAQQLTASRNRRDRKATIIDRNTGTAGAAGARLQRLNENNNNNNSLALNNSQYVSRSPSQILLPQSPSDQLNNSNHHQQQQQVPLQVGSGSTDRIPNFDQFKNIPVDGITGGLSITIGGGSSTNGDNYNNNNNDAPEADDDVADWLNNQFADAEERDAETGFDIPLLRRQSTVAGDVVDAVIQSQNKEQPTVPSPAPSPSTSQQQQQQSVSTSESSPSSQQQKELTTSGGGGGGRGGLESANAARSARIDYQRTHQRKTEARIANAKVDKILARHDIKFVPEVHSPDFDIFTLYNEFRASTATTAQATSRVFLAVCASVFCSYSFPFNLDFDLHKFFNFIRECEKLYAKNPYHNAIHAADVLQSTHIYLCTGDVNNYFSDTELFAVLFAAMVHDLGHLGTNNAFLQAIHHPTAILYNDLCIQESFHTSLAFVMLKNVQFNNNSDGSNLNNNNNNAGAATTQTNNRSSASQTNNNNDNNNNHNNKTDFLTGSHIWTEALYKDFRTTVIDIIWGTDMKNHATLMQSAAGILEDNIIEDSEVPSLLRAIVHAADLSNPLKPWEVYVEHAVRVVAEFWRQGDEEARRGLKISPMCDRNATNFAKAQKGFIDFVARPWMKTLEPVLPKIWLERLESNCAQVAAMSQEEVDKIHLRIAQHASTPFDDGIMLSVYSMLRKCVSPSMELFGSLKTKHPVVVGANAGTGGGGVGGSENSTSTTISSSNTARGSNALIDADLSPSEVAGRLRAQWSDIIKGLTSRGSLSQTAAVVTWANALGDANRRVPFLNIPDAMIKSLHDARDIDESVAAETRYVSRHLTSNSAEEARAVLGKLGVADFKDPFSFVRTLNLTVLDMTRPVGSPPRVSVPPHHQQQQPTSPMMNGGNYYNNNNSATTTTYSIQKNLGGGVSSTLNMDANNNMMATANTVAGAYYQRQLTSFASPQQQPSHHNGNNNNNNNNNNFVVSGADFNPRRNEVVRFFSEERPLVVPLETRTNNNFSSSGNSNNNNNYQTPTRGQQ